MYVCQIVLVQIFAELLGRNRRCHVIGEVRGGEGYVSVSISSGNCSESAIRDIPNYDIIGVLAVCKNVRNTNGCSTAEVAYIFCCGNGKVVYLFVTKQRCLLGGKISVGDSLISPVALESSCGNLNIASAVSKLILNALVESDNCVVKRYLVQRTNGVTRNVCSSSVCRNRIFRSVTSFSRAMISYHIVACLNVILNPIVSIGIAVRNLALSSFVIFTIFIFTILKLNSVVLAVCLKSDLYNVGPSVLFNVFGFLLRSIASRTESVVVNRVLTVLFIVEVRSAFGPACNGMSRSGYVISVVAVAALARVCGVALLRTSGVDYNALAFMRGIILLNVVAASGFIPMSTAIRRESILKAVTYRRRIIVFVRFSASAGVSGITLLGTRGICHCA